jgi:hypothetical protein
MIHAHKRRAIAWLAGAALLSVVPVASADVITDWNERAVAAGYAPSRIAPPMHARNSAIVHIAMFEAINSIEGRYAPYRKRLPAAPGTSSEVAAAAAASYALSRLYPAQARDFDKALQALLAGVPDGPAKADGIRLGEQAAAMMLAERSNDGADAPEAYRPFTVAGRYVPTVTPRDPSWGAVRPFAIKSGDAFRPAAPYALNTTQWAKDFNEVKTLGAKTGSSRTSEQSGIARFWEMTGPATTDPVARQLSATRKIDLVDNARLFALFEMALADSGIAVFDAKYAFAFWRPVTAIRNADIDGNDATTLDANWESFVPTPVHPEYPCAHCIFDGAAAAVLQSQFGNTVPRFTLTSSTAPDVTRSYVQLSDYVADVVNARVYGGMHYRSSGEVGAAMGRKIAEYTVQTQLLPVR